MAQIAHSTSLTLIVPVLLAAAFSALPPSSAQAGGMVPVATVISGSGTVATETRTIADFQAVLLQGFVDLKIRQGDKESIEVRAENNLLPLLETVVETTSKGRTLVVRWKRGESIRTSKGVTVAATVIKLESVAVEGAGDVVVENLTTPILSLTIAGSGDIVYVGSPMVKKSIAGSGSVRQR